MLPAGTTVGELKAGGYYVAGPERSVLAPGSTPVQMLAVGRAPSVETVVASTDDTVCCWGTKYELSESDKTITVRSQGIPRIGWAWGGVTALAGSAIFVCLGYVAHFMLLAVIGVTVSIILGAVLAILPRGCTKYVTVETHDKADVKHLALAHEETPGCCCEKLSIARFHSSVKDRVLEFPYRVVQAVQLQDAHRRCAGEYQLVSQPKTSFTCVV